MKTWSNRALVVSSALLASTAFATELRVMTTGLGSGRVTFNVGGADCFSTGGPACTRDLSGLVRLTPIADGVSVFAGWNVDLDPLPHPDCGVVGTECRVTVDRPRAVKARFDLSSEVPQLTSHPGIVRDAIDPDLLDAFLAPGGRGAGITTVAQFLAALPEEYRQGWMLMTRSESLQTGTAEYPRILLSSHTGKTVFTIGLEAHGAYPASNPVAIEYMQWDAVAKNFRFHEIRLQDLGPDRRRDVEKDDLRCSKCHSTRNVENRGPTPGTDQISPTRRLFKNKPNWDTYDNWGGLLAFNRDRIYRGSIEAAAFRKLLNLWTWRDRAPMRMIIEQLQLQPGAVEATLSSRPLQHVIRRVKGGATDGTPTFSFDDSARGPLEEPFRGMENYVGYAFDRVPTTTTGDRILWGAPDDFVQLFTPGSGGNVSDSDEGRGVELFDRLSTFNMTRVGDELGAHEWGTGSVRVRKPHHRRRAAHRRAPDHLPAAERSAAPAGAAPQRQGDLVLRL